MVRPLRIAASIGVVALGLAVATITVSATGFQGLRGSAIRVVAELTEPWAVLVWGSVLVVAGQMLRRRTTSS